MFFRDRHDAGRQLAEALRPLALQHPVVLGIPRGGVPVAAEVAEALGGELGVVVARKLRAPGYPELAIGAVTADGAAYINEAVAHDVGATASYIETETERQRQEAARREESFDGHRRPPVAGRAVVVVDDGIATGATAIAAVRAMKQAGASRVILAVPVSPPESFSMLSGECDEVVCPNVVEDFYAVGQFYADFRPTTDHEVRRLLQAHDDGSRPVSGPRPVTIERDGVRLSAVLTLPEGDQPFRCVVFVHGLGSGKDSPRNQAIAARLADVGFATLLFDLSSHGESDDDARGEAAFVDDLAAAVNWLRQQPGIESRIGIAGSSYGGMVAVHALHTGRVAADAMVLRAPPVDPGDLDGLTIPTLCIVGGQDMLLPSVRRAAERAPNVTLREVPGASHLFEEPGALECALDETVTWFKRHIPHPVAARL
jgi:predicted phosphoribosyltransferase/dienelactone hydrolase